MLARFVLRCHDGSWAGADQVGSGATRVRPVVAGDESGRSAVTLLARECATFGAGGSLAPAGLWWELQGRPGRVVHAWLAAPAPDAAMPRPCPAGLVSLVVSAAGGRRRFSIAWLLVHPLARRGGLGSGLVGIAVMHARSLGAETVHADTLTSWPEAVAFWHAVGFERLA
jgi:GNAT superfamily N-acetyltransferase